MEDFRQWLHETFGLDPEGNVTAPQLASPRAETAAPQADLTREELSRAPLGDGLARCRWAYVYRAQAEQPAEELSQCDGFSLQGDADAPLELEIDAADERSGLRKVMIIWPDGLMDGSNSARRLLQLAALLRRDTVLEALEAWAAEDAQATAQRRKRRAAMLPTADAEPV